MVTIFLNHILQAPLIGYEAAQIIWPYKSNNDVNNNLF